MNDKDKTMMDKAKSYVKNQMRKTFLIIYILDNCKNCIWYIHICCTFTFAQEIGAGLVMAVLYLAT